MQGIMQTSHQLAAQKLSSKHAVAPGLVLPKSIATRQRLAVQTCAAKNPFKAPFKAKSEYDANEPQVNPAQSAFTRRREIFVGRTAMTGFFSGVIGELLTGRGVIGQLNLETSLSPYIIKALIAAVVGFNLFTALLPGGTFSEENQQDVKKRPAGGVQKPGKINLAKDPAGTLGIDKGGFGFSKANELFVGRVAMLGFAADLIGEQLTGKGPLAQIGLGTGQPLNPELAGFGLAVWVGFFALAAVGFGKLGEQTGGNDIY